MGYLKQHLLKVQEAISPHEFGCLAIEHGYYTGVIKLTGDLQADIELAASRYSQLCDDYQNFVQNGPRPIEVDFFKVEGFHCDPTTPQDPSRELTRHLLSSRSAVLPNRND